MRLFLQYFPIIAVTLLTTQQAIGDTVLVDEQLDDQACNAPECSRENGQFVAGQGWKPDSSNSRLIFDLSQHAPNGIACGSVELEFTNFDPVTNFGGDFGDLRIFFLSIYEGVHGNIYTASDNDETRIIVSAGCESCIPDSNPGDWWRDQRLKIGSLACSWDYPECGDINRWIPAQNQDGLDWANNMSLHYTVAVSWDCNGVSYALTDASHNWSSNGTWQWHANHSSPKPHLRYFFVGHDKRGNNWVRDAIYVSLKITEHSTCNCCQCTAPLTQQQNCGDCGTQERSCKQDCTWGEWTDCQGPDPGGECDTGLFGICAEGIERCENGYLECEQVNSLAPEICDDLLDNNCNNIVDDPLLCDPEDGGVVNPDSAVDGSGDHDDFDGYSDKSDSNEVTTDYDLDSGCSCKSVNQPIEVGAVLMHLNVLIFLMIRLFRRRPQKHI